jgi:hypothetical protein
MALSYINVTIGGEVKQAIEVTPIPTQTVILKEVLSEVDIVNLTRASNAIGITFLEKMQNTTASNGVLCIVLYNKLVIDPIAYSASVQTIRDNNNFDVVAEINTIDGRLNSLENFTISTSVPNDLDGKTDGAVWYRVLS